MLHLKSTDPANEQTEMLVIPVCEDKDLNNNPAIKDLVGRIRRLKEFKGAAGEEIILYDPVPLKAKRVKVVGLGKTTEVSADNLRSLGGRAIGQATDKKLSTLSIVVPETSTLMIGTADILEALLEGACLGNHRFEQYRTKKTWRPIKRINLLTRPDKPRKYKSLAPRVTAICQGTIQARDWVNIPANAKKPTEFARTVVRQAKKQGLRTTVLNKKELKAGKFGAIMAVSQGSNSAPSMVILEHKPRNAKQTVVLVGKGVTFDSGGLNLKTSKNINLMKIDMAGAAAVAATVMAAAKLSLKVHVVGVLPLVENMVSGKSIRPGDIIRTYSGKTVEIGNTDAEGRLILADAISFSIKKYKPEFLIDMATLTGACVVALGESFAGLFSNNDALATGIVHASEKTGERCWRLPLPDDYKKMLKSDLADINNMPKSRWGAAITAALFLSEFAGDTSWVHIDIAGPAYQSKGSDYCEPGGSGFGVRLLCNLLYNL
jgi:leucyl aminopeptidase